MTLRFFIGFTYIQYTDACFSFKNEPNAPPWPNHWLTNPNRCWTAAFATRRNTFSDFVANGLGTAADGLAQALLQASNAKLRGRYSEIQSLAANILSPGAGRRNTHLRSLCATHVGEAPCADSNVLWGNHCGLRSQAPTSFRQPALRTCVSSSRWARASLPNRSCRLGSIGTC